MDRPNATVPLTGVSGASRMAHAAMRREDTARPRRSATITRTQVLAAVDPAQLQASAYIPTAGDTLLDKYVVQYKLGSGSFGTVVKAQHLITGTVVAVKVLHQLEHLHGDVRHEERVYEALLAGCSPRISLFAKVFESGVSNGLNCMVFELCDITLYDVMKGVGQLNPLPPTHICEIANQIVRGAAYLHSLGIIHTDIKPDNIALRRADTVEVRRLDETGVYHTKRVLVSTAICILDFGGAITNGQASQKKTLFCGKMYRAPEAVLGLPWSHGVDTYAVGCVIAELYLTGNLFYPEIASDREHLALIERILGPFPLDFASTVEAMYPGTFRFDHSPTVIFPPGGITFAGEQYARPMQRILDAQPISADIHDVDFVDFLRKLLTLDPSKRDPLETTLRHIYFNRLRYSGRS